MAKNVLVTGASRGIGAATARYFAQQGWNVALNYCHSRSQALSLAAELSTEGVETVALEGDVSDPEQAAAVVAAAQGLGPLDALVCCAGVALPQQLITDTTNEQWRKVMGVDLDGVFYTIRAACPGFVRRQQGAIVTVSSMWGETGGSCEVAYSAAKAGVIGLTKALAKELGPSHVRVNCVAPGVIDTQMNAHLSQQDYEVLREEAPLGRIGTPSEVAHAIYYLASEQASFITGQIVRVDGGMVI
ncbi:MAG: elongation factor P 5-aminopentanone reductase [Lawsonibacter sp.]